MLDVWYLSSLQILSEVGSVSFFLPPERLGWVDILNHFLSCRIDPGFKLSGLDLYRETKSINAQIHADSIWMKTFCSVIFPGSHRNCSETLFRTTLQITLYIEADYTNKVFAE